MKRNDGANKKKKRKLDGVEGKEGWEKKIKGKRKEKKIEGKKGRRWKGNRKGRK